MRHPVYVRTAFFPGSQTKNRNAPQRHFFAGVMGVLEVAGSSER
jgi:hypothetical protein